MSDREAEFREFVAARMELLRGLAYLTCGDWQVAVDERLRMRAALDGLPTRQRAVLVLRFLEGLSVQQTAEALQCPEGTVKVYTARGLDTMRKILGPELEARHEAAV